VLACGLVAAVGVAANGVMTATTAKIVRHVMAEIDAVIAPQADERQHKLTDQDGSTDHRTDHEK